MPKQRIVSLAAGGGYTDVLATIAAHYVKIYEDGSRSKAFMYKLPNDTFTQVYTTKAGDFIELLGAGRGGIVGRPPGYNAYQIPATGDIVIQMKAFDDSATDVVVLESVSEL